MATLMLEGGADIRYIQEILGHEELRSTQIYTRVSIRALLEQVHSATHPARIERKHQAATDGESPDDRTATDAEELFSSLAAEADDEEGTER